MKKNKLKVFLDDLRQVTDIYPTAQEGEWTVVRTLKDFKGLIVLFGVPSCVSLDNDLGPDMEEGKDAVKWMVFEKMLDISEMDFTIHSANSSGVREYMEGTLTNWKNELINRKNDSAEK